MWKNPLFELPDDQEIVWIRVGTNYGNPCLALYEESNQTFVSEENGLIIPAYMIARWRSQ